MPDEVRTADGAARYVRRPAGLPAPGAYSHISTCSLGTLVHIAGQVGLDETGDIAGDGSVSTQTARVFANLERALTAVGAVPQDLVRTVTYVVDRASLPEFTAARNEALGRLFPDGKYPPNTLLLVAGLANPNLHVEIEATAMLRGDPS